VAVVSQREFSRDVAEAARGLARLRTAVFVEDESGAAPPAELEPFDYERVVSDASPARDFASRSADDLYVIYTGGTTGMPKGVMWRHEDVFFAGLQGGRPGDDPIERPEQLAEHVRDPDNALNILPAAPFIHGAAQWGALICLFSGGKL